MCGMKISIGYPSACDGLNGLRVKTRCIVPKTGASSRRLSISQIANVQWSALFENFLSSRLIEIVQCFWKTIQICSANLSVALRFCQGSLALNSAASQSWNIHKQERIMDILDESTCGIRKILSRYTKKHKGEDSWNIERIVQFRQRPFLFVSACYDHVDVHDMFRKCNAGATGSSFP